jgi:hypothetical protein
MNPTTIDRKAMKPGVFIRLGILCAIVAIPAFANSQTLKTPQAEPFKVIGALLAIKSPATNACPAQAKIAGWITTNKPGPVSYMIAKEGGGVSGPFTVNAVKTANGATASFSRNLEIHQAIDTKYRMLVPNATGNVMSNWVPLKASCKIQLGG